MNSQFIEKSYLTNNNFAYKYDTDGDWMSELKTDNFVPTYDHWCLACNNKDASKRCSRCKSVYFCDRDCQIKAWKIHRPHCGRDLFTLCCHCGDHGTIKCPDCPVKFCSVSCKASIIRSHKEFGDCAEFANMVNNG